MKCEVLQFELTSFLLEVHCSRKNSVILRKTNSFSTILFVYEYRMDPYRILHFYIKENHGILGTFLLMVVTLLMIHDF